MVNHLKAWREYRGMTQAALAKAAGTTKGQVSRLEKGQRRLAQDWLEKLAPPLRTTAGGLLAPPPSPGNQRESAPGATDRGHSPSFADEVGEADVTEAELLVLDILRDLPKSTQRNIIRAAIRQLDHTGEEERKAAHPRRRA